ncbi:MAG: hypothetical protein OEY14_00975, partial [Myxococcales bacterium]|nr:hypothetical protein [Myxococcales bacterium]
ACDAAGVCAPRPDFCPAVFDPVCGCDRRTYGNGCEAAAAGVNVAARGECLAACLLRPRASCCFGDADCSGGAKCYGARCIAGAEGVCKSGAELRVGECWGDIDCGSGRLCVGSSICPCGAFCFAPDAPGTCT